MFPHSEICGYNAHLRLPAAYRSLSRPSSAPDAKAFTLCSCSLELPYDLSVVYDLFQDLGSRFSQNCLSFYKLFRDNIFRVKGFSLYTFVLFHFREIVFTLTGKTYFRILAISI